MSDDEGEPLQLPPLSETHHQMIQIIMSRPFTSEKLLSEHLTTVSRRTSGQVHANERLQDFIYNINQHLELPLGLQIESSRDEHSGETFYSIINLRQDKGSVLSSAYTPPQIEFYKLLIRRLLIEYSNEGEMDETVALNMVAMKWEPPQGTIPEEAPKEMPANFWNELQTVTAVQRLIHRLVDDGWLARNPRNREKISLGLRALMELQEVIPELVLEDYGPAQCTMCQYSVFVGLCCVTPNCEVKVHHHCAREFFRGRPEWKCPTCSVEWERGDDAPPPQPQPVDNGPCRP